MTDEEYVIVLKNCAFMLADGIKYMKEEQKKEFKKAYERAIEKLSAEPQEWISVKDRLPEKNDCYLVTFNFESNGNPDNGIGVVEFYDGNFYSNGFGVNEDVAAWYSNPVPLSPYRRYRE